MSSGSHSSTVVLQGKVDGLVKGAKQSASSLARVEDQVERLEKQMRQLNTKLDQYADRTKRAEASTDRLRQKQKLLKSGFRDAGLQIQGWIGTAREAAEVVDQLAQRQFNLDNVQKNLPFSIDKAREATQGLVSDYDLMQQAIQANRLGVAKSGDAFAAMAGTATKLGVSVGKDATQSLDDFTNGLGRGSTEVLDNLGIMLKAEEAYKAYAVTLGKTSKQLTDAEKRQAVITIGLKKGEDAAAKTSLAVDGLGASWQRAKVEAQNYLDTMLKVGENSRELAEETLKSLGATGEQATETLDGLGTVAEKSLVHVFTFGLSTAIEASSAALDEMGDETEQLVTQLERGREPFSLFTMFLHETGDAGERAAKVADKVTLAFSNAAVAGAAAEEQAFFDATREDRMAQRRLQLKDEQETRKAMAKLRKEDRKKARAAFVAAKEAQLQVNVAAARRELDVERKRLEQGATTTTALIGHIEAQAAAERDLASFHEKSAKSSAQRITAQGQLEAVAHTERMAIDVARLEQAKALEEQLTAVAESQQQRIDRDRELGMVEAEIAANRAMRGAEQIEDPLDRLERETQIRLELIDVQMRAANDPVDAMQLADQREAAIHDRKLARLAEERAEREKSAQQLQAFVSRSSELHLGAAQSVATAVLLEGKSLKESVKNTAATEGAKQAIIGAAELIRAAVAAASFNYPKAALHVANAGAAFAFAGAMGATYGVASIGGKGRSVSAAPGLGEQGFAGGGAPSSSGGGASSPRSADSSPIPPSAAPGIQEAAGGLNSTGQVVNINVTGPVYGTTDKKFVQQIDRDLRDLSYSSRRASA